MARVIKQGKCAYSFLKEQAESTPDTEDQQDASFNSLFCLVPPDPEESIEVASSPEQASTESCEDESRLLLEKARAEAESLRAEAEEVLAAAKAKAADIESQAYSQGYEQGQKDGEEIGRKQFSVGLRKLETVLENLKSQSAKLGSMYEAQMLQVCLIVASRIIQREITSERELIARVLMSSLDKVVDGSSIIVHVNPRDAEGLSESFLERLSSPGGNSIEVKSSASVKRGGCLIETEFGLIDASIESRWNALLEEIGETLKERTGMELDEAVRKLT